MIAVVALVETEGKFLAIKTENRGTILPGGKLKEGEDYEHGVLRELAEETGVSGRVERLVFHGMNLDQRYVYVFKVQVAAYSTMKGSDEGEPCFAEKAELMQSVYAPFYKMMFKSLENFDLDVRTLIFRHTN